MKQLLRTSLGCLFIALALNALFSYGQTLAPLAPPLENLPDPPWLQVNTHNPSNNQSHRAEWTVLISSRKPIVKQIRTDCWEISFEH